MNRISIILQRLNSELSDIRLVIGLDVPPRQGVGLKMSLSLSTIDIVREYSYGGFHSTHLVALHYKHR